jgi:hypothetical protein
VQVSAKRSNGLCLYLSFRHIADSLRTGYTQASTNPYPATQSRRHIMLNALRTLGKKYFSPGNRYSSEDQTRQTATRARDDRASMVNALRDDITRIQHQISDLNDAMAAEGIGETPGPAKTAKMASLHQELARKQQELGKYQARI